MSTGASQPAGEARGCDTQDLLTIHGMYRQLFSRAPGAVERAPAEDANHVRFVRDRLEEAMESLQRHHEHEDDLWWERLKERAPEARQDVERLELEHRGVALQLEQLKPLVKAWAERPRDKDGLIAALRRLHLALEEHLLDEERHVMPLAARVLTQKEWDEASERGRRDIPKGRALIQLGYMLHCAPTEALRRRFERRVPPPVIWIYKLTARKKFEREWQRLYGERP